MSMQHYLIPEHFNTRYNCTNINIDDVPLEVRTRYTPLAYAVIVLSTAYYIFYVPCVISLWKNLSNSCYKMLFYKAITDLGILWIIGYVHAILTLKGAIYCSYPNFNYICGVACICLWIAESNAEAIVSMNRCFALLSPSKTSLLFDGYKTWVWLSFPTAFALYWSIFDLPVLFNPIYWSWFFNPYVGYLPDNNNLYESRLHSVNNMYIAFGIPLIYFVFALVLWMKTRGISGHGGSAVSINKKQLITFVQILIISSMNLVGCTAYVYMKYFGINETLIVVVQFLWLHIHGFPPVIYLTMNKTIQTDAREMLKGALKRLGWDVMAHTGVVSVPSQPTR